MRESEKLVPRRRFNEFINGDGWEQRNLSEISLLITKGTTPLDKSGTGSVNFVKIENIDSSSGEITSTAKISLEEHEGYLKRSQLKQNDILFSIAGSLGLVSIVKSNILPANTNQALAILRIKEGDLGYLVTVLKCKTVSDYIRKYPTIGAQPNLSLQQVGALKVPYPKLSEQHKIGEYFLNLDNLIAIHQRKLEKIKALKSAYLSEMFPIKGECKPKRRFAGFTEEWVQRKAVDIAEYSKGNGYSKNDLKEIGTSIILYGRLYTKYQIFIDEVDTFSEIKDGAIFSKGNEVIIPASGETAEDIARASAVIKPGILLGGDLNILRPFEYVNPLFLALTISNGYPKRELAKKAQGKSVVHIHNSDIQEINISYPSRQEQDLIVDTFRNLENLITFQQRKLEKLQNIKKGLLNEMFI